MTADDRGLTGPDRRVPGEPFGYLAVRVGDGEVRTFGRTAGNRYLGRLAGARAGMELRRFGYPAEGLTIKGIGPKLAGTVSIEFADGTRYKRALLARALLDAPKIESEIAKFNELAQSCPA